MDKLEPILKQKFWIILGLGVIMTITGWWMATGSLAATITARKDALKKVEESIPSGEVPNNDWSTKLGQINNRQEAMVSSVRRALWEQQQATHFWPLNVDEFAKDAKYRDEFGLTARELYRTNYLANAEEVWKRARPINPLDGTGIVMFPFEKMPKKSFTTDLAPRSDEIWDAQEDLWLLVPILDAIREVNGGESGTRLDAVVHIIDRLELMGGERSAGEGGAAASPMGSGYPGGGPAEGGIAEMNYPGGFESGSMAGAGVGGRGAAATPKVAADFDFKEEFGSTGVSTGGCGGGSFFGESADYANAMGGAESGGGGSVAAPTIRRYIDEGETLPYKTRGFYISMVMDHRKVPNLIGELTANGASPWPIEIVRVQISRINDDDTEGRGLGAGNMMAGAPGGSAGYPGGSAGYAGAETYSPESATGLNETPAFENYGEESGGVGYPGGYPGAMNQAQGGLSFEAALADPFMARVALAGLIYIYTEPGAAAEPVSEPTEPPVAAESDPAAVNPTAATATPVPADGSAPAVTENAPATDEAATPAPAAAGPETTEPQPTPATTPTPATPEPAPATPAPEPAPAAPTPQAGTEPPPN